MKTVRRAIQVRQIRHFYLADPKYGEGVARGLGIDISEVMKSTSTEAATHTR